MILNLDFDRLLLRLFASLEPATRWSPCWSLSVSLSVILIDVAAHHVWPMASPYSGGFRVGCGFLSMGASVRNAAGTRSK